MARVLNTCLFSASIAFGPSFFAFHLETWAKKSCSRKKFTVLSVAVSGSSMISVPSKWALPVFYARLWYLAALPPMDSIAAVVVVTFSRKASILLNISK